MFAGTPDTAVPALEALLASRHEVLAVLTRPDTRAGRGRRPVRPPVAQRAAADDVEVLTPPRPGDPAFLDRLRELAPDCCPVVAYGALLPQSALDVPRLGWVNLHFSVLPAWRGAAPVQHAVLHGDPVTGATTFRIVSELDAGPVFAVVTEEIRAAETAGTLLERLAVTGAALLVDTLDHLEEGDLVARPQPADGISYAPKLAVADARIRWADPAFAVDRRIRACTPAPGAWTTVAGARLKVAPVRHVPNCADLPPGRVRVADGVVQVGTATSVVALGDVQPAGKRAMPAMEWVRGARLPDDVLLGEGPG